MKKSNLTSLITEYGASQQWSFAEALNDRKTESKTSANGNTTNLGTVWSGG